MGAPVVSLPVVEGEAEAVLLWPPWGPPDGRAVPYEALAEVVVEPLPAESCLKFAQAMRVLLDRWKTMDLSAKKEGSDCRVARKSSLYLAERSVLGGVNGGESGIHSAESGLGDVPVLARKIASLAGRLCVCVADGGFPTFVGVQMSTGGSAVAVLGNRLLVDVVHW